MPANETVQISIRARMNEFEQEMKKIPGVTEKEAKKMVQALGQQLARTEKAAKKAFEETRGHGASAFKEIGEAGDRVFSELGGVFGDIGGALSTFIESGAKAGGALGGVAGGATLAAGAIAGATLAVGFLAGEMISFVDGADEAVERLHEISGIQPLSGETLASLDEWNQGQLAAEAGGKRLHAVLAGELAQAFGDLPVLISAVTNALADGVEAAGAFTDKIDDVQSTARKTLAVMTLGTTELIAWATGFDQATEAAREHVDAVDEVGESVKEARDFAREAAIALGLLVDEEQEAADAKERASRAKLAAADAERAAAADAADREAVLTRMTNEHIAATELLQQITESANASALSQTGKLIAAHEAKNEKIREALEITGDVAAAQAAQAAVDEELERELLARREELRAEHLERLKKAEAQTHEEIGEIALDSFNRTASAFGDVVGLMIKQGEDLTEAEKARALFLFDLQKTAALTQIAVNTAVAITKALAELGPIAGPIAATGAAQAAVVMAQQPPEFPSGGMVTAEHLGSSTGSPDHGAVGVQAGEGIVNHRGMAALGEDGLNALNGGGGLGGTLVVEQRYRHKVFDRFVKDNLRRGGPLGQAIHGVRRPGHSNRS
jgi:hypothetical protein